MRKGWKEGDEVYLQSASLRTATAACSCSETTFVVSPVSRCSSVSPMQRMTEIEAASAALVFCATISLVSWNRVRRSEWPFVRQR
jgi:hypothetical protein